MTDQRDSYNAESKFSGVRVLPENLTIVGVDVPDDQRPELAQPERVRIALSPSMTRSIMRHGIRQPIRIKRFDGDDLTYVVAGRRRVLHAREANKQLKRDGADPVLVPCVPEERGSDVVVTQTIENEHRVDSTTLMKAEQAARYKERGYDDAYICDLYDITRQTLRDWLALAEASPKIKRAVESREITSVVGREIAKLPVEEQESALEQAKIDGRGSAALENVRELKKRRLAKPVNDAANEPEDGPPPPKRLNPAAQRRFAMELIAQFKGGGLKKSDAYDVRLALQLMKALSGGGPRALASYPAVREAFKAAGRGPAADKASKGGE